jgi:hypothetical protein
MRARQIENTPREILDGGCLFMQRGTAGSLPPSARKQGTSKNTGGDVEIEHIR